MMQPWKGDLDGMIERGVIRVLAVYSKTFYFMDKGVQRGATYDAFRVFEEDLNKKLAKQQKLKQKHLKVKVVFIPIGRGDLLQALADGKGDIAASNLTITAERQKLVDFSVPVYRQRQRGGGVRPRLTRRRKRGRSVRERSVRAQVLQLLREPGGAQPAPGRAEKTRRDHQAGAGGAGGRGPASRW